MARQYVISERDYRRLQELLRWYERYHLVLPEALNRYRRRRPTGGGTGISVRRAITTQDAPADTKITANLYDSAGIEQTEGDESNIDVYCSIAGGGNLDAAVPRLRNDTDIDVVKLPYDNEGTPEDRWFCIAPFNASKECVCTPP